MKYPANAEINPILTIESFLDRRYSAEAKMPTYANNPRKPVVAPISKIKLCALSNQDSDRDPSSASDPK